MQALSGQRQVPRRTLTTIDRVRCNTPTPSKNVIKVLAGGTRVSEHLFLSSRKHIGDQLIEMTVTSDQGGKSFAADRAGVANNRQVPGFGEMEHGIVGERIESIELPPGQQQPAARSGIAAGWGRGQKHRGAKVSSCRGASCGHWRRRPSAPGGGATPRTRGAAAWTRVPSAASAAPAENAASVGSVGGVSWRAQPGNGLSTGTDWDGPSHLVLRANHSLP